MTQLVEAATNAALQAMTQQQHQSLTSSPIAGVNRPPSTPPPPKRRDTNLGPASKSTANSSLVDASLNNQNA
jgi:hypothetical protein